MALWPFFLEIEKFLNYNWFIRKRKVFACRRLCGLIGAVGGIRAYGCGLGHLWFCFSDGLFDRAWLWRQYAAFWFLIEK